MMILEYEVMKTMRKLQLLTVILLLIVVPAAMAAKVVKVQSAIPRTAPVVTEQQSAPEPATSKQESTPAAAPAKDPRSGEQINWWVVSGGGGQSTMGSFILGSTIGQTAVGTSSIGSLELHSGFWQNFGESHLCGDVDGTKQVDIADAVYLVNYIFGGGPEPLPFKMNGDVDCSGLVDIADAVYLVNYIFGGGPAPCAAC
jgi:hypothetical protein